MNSDTIFQIKKNCMADYDTILAICFLISSKISLVRRTRGEAVDYALGRISYERLHEYVNNMTQLLIGWWKNNFDTE